MCFFNKPTIYCSSATARVWQSRIRYTFISSYTTPLQTLNLSSPSSFELFTLNPIVFCKFVKVLSLTWAGDIWYTIVKVCIIFLLAILSEITTYFIFRLEKTFSTHLHRLFLLSSFSLYKTRTDGIMMGVLLLSNWDIKSTRDMILEGTHNMLLLYTHIKSWTYSFYYGSDWNNVVGMCYCIL